MMSWIRPALLSSVYFFALPALAFDEPQAVEILALSSPGAEKVEAQNETPSDAKRLEQVEAELKRLNNAEQKRKDEAAKKPVFVVGGQIQADYLAFGQNTANQASIGDVPDGAYFRRARIVGRGDAFDVVEYSIGFDFALPGRPSFLDVFVG